VAANAEAAANVPACLRNWRRFVVAWWGLVIVVLLSPR
jgi:hypothetical protein